MEPAPDLRSRSLLRQARAQSASPGRCGTLRKPSEGWMRSRRLPRNGRSSRPPGRVVTTWDRARWALIQWIAVTHERIREFETGAGPKPVLRQFSFDENRGPGRRPRAAVDGAGGAGTGGCPRAGRRGFGPNGEAAVPLTVPAAAVQAKRPRRPPGPRAQRHRSGQRLMQGTDGGHLRGCSAQPAVSGDGLIISAEVVQDCNDPRQRLVALAAARLPAAADETWFVWPQCSHGSARLPWLHSPLPNPWGAPSLGFTPRRNGL
jgi:hypothetical protein